MFLSMRTTSFSYAYWGHGSISTKLISLPRAVPWLLKQFPYAHRKSQTSFTRIIIQKDR